MKKIETKRISGYKYAPLLVVSALLSACGTNAAGSSNAASTNSNQTTASTAPSTTTTQSAAIDSSSPIFSKARLTSLTNYSFTLTIGNGSTSSTVTGKINSSTNYEIAVGPIQTYHVDGHSYEVVGNQTPQRVTLGLNFYNLQGVSSAANTFIQLASVGGVTVRSNGQCNVAGTAGTSYVESTSSNQSNSNQSPVACIANGSGALLSLTQGTPSTAASSTSGQYYSFEVTGIGNVPQIQLP